MSDGPPRRRHRHRTKGSSSARGGRASYCMSGIYKNGRLRSRQDALLETRRNVMRQEMLDRLGRARSDRQRRPARRARRPTGRRQELADLAWMAGSWASTEERRRPRSTGPSRRAASCSASTATSRERRPRSSSCASRRRRERSTYLASPQGSPATAFELVESSAQKAVFANPKHDFPQRILYWRDGKSCAPRSRVR